MRRIWFGWRGVLDGDASPMEDGIGEASVTSISSDDEAALPDRLVTGATPVRHRRA